MISIRLWRLARFAGLAGVALMMASTAAAQGAVGSGPLTATLADSEPETGVIRLGPVRLAPGLTIRELGHDDNVFDEADNPKEDYVVAGTPDISVFTRLRFVQVSAYAGSDMQYYKEYESERAIGHSFRGRVTMVGSRLTPFFGAGTHRTRTRPNGEIDVRADLQTDELSGGLAYELSTNAQAFGAAIQSDVDYRDAFQSGISLEQSLSRRSTEYQSGIRTDLTPFLSLQLRGAYKEDEFRLNPNRNGDSRMGTAVLVIDTAAVISGSATFGYQDYQPVDPLIAPYRGVIGSGLITYPFLELGRFNFGYNRGIEYSFDEAEGYYVDTSFNLAYTHRLFGEVDAQGSMARSFFTYGNGATTPEREDTLESYNGNLGYNMRNKTRIAAHYDYARRRSPEIASRNYIRRRVYLSWTVAF